MWIKDDMVENGCGSKRMWVKKDIGQRLQVKKTRVQFDAVRSTDVRACLVTLRGLEAILNSFSIFYAVRRSQFPRREPVSSPTRASAGSQC